jgi:hypothetical protein
MLKDWSLKIPENYERQFPSCLQRFDLISTQNIQCFNPILARLLSGSKNRSTYRHQ